MKCARLCNFAAMAFLMVWSTGGGTARDCEADDAVSIGSRRELFVDHYLIDRLEGAAELVLQRPQPQEVVLTTDRPWEGNTSAYFTLFQDGDVYRMYYRGSHFDETAKKATHPEVTCYAESRDGVRWTKPDLALVEFDGSKHNNIVWDGVGSHCLAVFKDSNPDSPDAARYKAMGRGHPTHPKGLYTLTSRDGVHWNLTSESPVITEGAFDSQNLAFWDSNVGLYREYHRTFDNGVRHILTGTSTDFVNWTQPTLLSFPGKPVEHLYTNAVLPYPRAPHLLLGFPTRYLPDEGQRVEPTFMSSRDGRSFHRWTDAVIPESAPKDRSGNRSNYMAWGLLKLPHNDREYSVYATEAYYTGPDSRLRRFTYRVDGFVAVHAATNSGSVLTKPLRFNGAQLSLNAKTVEGGAVRVELQDAGGTPIPGYTLSECDSFRGDEIDQVVTWSGNADVGPLSGEVVRIRFELQNGDLYAFQFGSKR